MEAAQCYLHCTALVAEYLSLMEEENLIQQSNINDEFAHLSDNIYEENVISEDIFK